MTLEIIFVVFNLKMVVTDTLNTSSMYNLVRVELYIKSQTLTYVL